MTPAGTSTSLTSAPVPAPVLDVESVEPAPKKKRLSRLEKRREARVRAAAGGGDDNDSAESQAVLIGREVWVYLVEQGQLDVDAFNLLGFWNRRGIDSVCPTTSTVTSPAEIPYLPFIALGCTMGSRPPAVRPCETFRRFPTSLMTCAVGGLQVRSSA